MTVFCVKCGDFVEDAGSSECPRCQFDAIAPRPEDRLHVAAKRYHEMHARLRALDDRDDWPTSADREAARDDLEAAAGELHLAADEYGRNAG